MTRLPISRLREPKDPKLCRGVRVFLSACCEGLFPLESRLPSEVFHLGGGCSRSSAFCRFRIKDLL
jgi:hypothetical protein